MFSKKHFNNKFWMIAVILIALVTVTVVLQAQILMMLKDLQTTIFRSFTVPTSVEQVSDSNPLPMMPVDTISDSNPNPPMRSFSF